jgi:hypothetical protein
MRLTGSKLPIARHCGWALREDTTYPERPRGESADEGNKVHEKIANDLLMRARQIGGDDEQLVQQAFKYLGDEHMVYTNGVKPEVTYAWDPKTGKARLLGQMLNRDYSSADPHEVVGTVDFVIVKEDHVVVGDWKSHFTSHVTLAKENAQLIFGALCAAQVHGLKRARIDIIGLQPKRYELDSHWLERLDLMVWDAEFRRIVESLPSAQAKKGGHCTWCPALGACPETESLVKVESVEIQNFKFTTQFISKENDEQQVLHLPALKKAVEELEKSLKGRYPEGISLPNGKLWRPSLVKKDQFDKEKAIKLLGQRADECYYQTEYETWRQVKAK